MRGSLCGYVLSDTDGSPVRQALVEAVAGAALEPRTTHSDAGGWFVLDGLPPGRWLLHAWTPDHRMGEASAPVFVNAFTDVIIRVDAEDRDEGAGGARIFKSWVARMQHGNVDGTVIQAGTGEPVADASITVAAGAGPAPDISPLTDEQGRFRLDGLAPGEWTLRALGPGGELGEATVRVPAGSTARMAIELGR